MSVYNVCVRGREGGREGEGEGVGEGDGEGEREREKERERERNIQRAYVCVPPIEMEKYILLPLQTKHDRNILM